MNAYEDFQDEWPRGLLFNIGAVLWLAWAIIKQAVRP